MALSKGALVLVLLTISLCGASLGAVHKVGDSAGWTTKGDVDYRKWASSHQFMVGDTLVFEYNKQFHNVIRVTHQDFRSCNATSPIVSYTSGSDSITIKRPGHLYFLCGIPGHCQQGQKVDIRVPRASLSPASSPSNAPTGSPAASPTTSPDRDGAPSPIQSDSAFLHCSKLWLVLGLLSVFLCSAVPAME